MMTSPNGNIFRVTGPLWRESTRQRCIPLPKASEAELWCFLRLRLNKRLSKQSRRRWFETPSCSIWRHCNSSEMPAVRKVMQFHFVCVFALPYRAVLLGSLSSWDIIWLIDWCRSSTHRVLYNTQLRNDSYIYIYIYFIFVYISKLIKLVMSFILSFC